ncbi:MFS transporter [bacterium]|nr:MFS transporter [bacterium]
MQKRNPAILSEAGLLAPGSAAAVSQRCAGVLIALFIIGFTTFLNLYVTQPLLPLFRQLFNASELLVSLTVSAPVLAVAMAAPVVGLLADAIGRKRVIVAAIFGLAIPSLLAASSDNLPQLIVWRFLQGIFIPGIIAVTMAYISEESPRHLAGSTMATYVTGTVVGGFCGRFIAGICATHFGWREAFVILGAATLAGGMAGWWLLPRSTRFVRQRNAAASIQALKMHLRNPQLLATYAVGFNVLFCLVGTFTYVNFYLADKPFHLGPGALASVFAVYLIGAVMTPVAGYLLDRIGCRGAQMGAAAVAAIGMLLTLVHSVAFVVAGLALAATGAFASQSAASSHIGRAAGKARSSAAGLYVALYYLGGFVGSVLPGMIWGVAGWPGCVGLIIVFQATTAAIAGKLWKE